MADTPTKRGRRDFQDVLTDIDGGKLHEELTALLPDVVRRVRETNKQGSLTLVLSIKMERGNVVAITPKVSTKMPAPGLGGQLLYTDEEGNLSTDDPRQVSLKILPPTPIKGKGDN